jgi:hypothetical protein
MATGSVSAIDQDNWQLISTTSFNGSSQYTIATGLAGAYKSLMVVWQASSKEAAGKPQIQFNGDTTAGNYSSNAWFTETTNTANSSNGLLIEGTADFSTEAGGYAIFDNCNSTVVPVITRNAGGRGTSGAQGVWHGYAAVTSLNFRSLGGQSFTTGTVKLFGIAG